MLDLPLVRAVILGIVQGLTEFLPVSSSGHLVVVPYLLSWRPPGLAFDVALHAGTLVAILAYFAGDVWYLLTRPFGLLVSAPGEAARARRTLGLLAVGTVPAAVAGVTLNEAVEEAFERPLVVAAFFLVTAGLLAAAEAVRRRRARTVVPAGGPMPAHVDPGRDETTVGFVDAALIGLFQAFALLPGLSRSGATIAAGMFRGLSREAAARFSFLLMIPAVAGAMIVELPELFGTAGLAASGFTLGEVAAGATAAALSGYWAVRFLLRLVQTDDLGGFARYLVALAVVVLLGYLWIGPPSAV